MYYILSRYIVQYIYMHIIYMNSELVVINFKRREIFSVCSSFREFKSETFSSNYFVLLNIGICYIPRMFIYYTELM